MRFSLTSDQTGLRDAARDLLADVCPPAVVRAAWSGPTPATGAVWQRLAEMGLFGAAVPEAAGGLGLSETDVVPLLMETGYAAVPHPVAETMAVAAPLLERADVTAGAVRVAVARAGAPVAYGRDADLVLVLDDASVRVVAGGRTPVDTVDGSLAAARVDGGGELVSDDPHVARLAAARLDLATAAQLVGLGRRMLDLTTAYVGTRQQFGVPVGSFQAIKHHLADALLRLEFAAPAVLAAGWELAQRTDGNARAVSLAAVLAAEAATAVARSAIQCHGAIGYTVEYDLHLFVKRAWALAAAVPVDAHLARLADALEI